MLKKTDMTRQETVAFLKLNMMSHSNDSLSGEDYVNGCNDILDHLIYILSDSNLTYNTGTGYFEPIGSI